MSDEIVRDYDGVLGVDLQTPFPKRIPAQSQRMSNAKFLYSGSVTTREGWQYNANNNGGLGICEYVQTVAGLEQRTLFDVGANLYQLKSGTFAITYTGAAASVIVQMLVDLTTNTWKFQVAEDGVTVLLYDCGVGINEAAPKTLTDLRTAILGISGSYAVVITGDSTQPAAFLPQAVNQVLSGAPLTISLPFKYSEQFRQPAGFANLFSGHQAARNLESIRNATYVNFRKCLIIATEEDYPIKMDGSMAYRFGMAKGGLTSATPSGVGALAATWRYMVRYSHTDAQGNYNPGTFSAVKSATPASNAQVDLVVPTIPSSSGFATNQGKVNGNQVGVNAITVLAGHGLVAGDMVFLLDRSASSIYGVERRITAAGATSITISGTPVNVNNNDIISHNLRIEIIRTKNNSQFFYLVAELPNNSSVSSITHADNLTDANVGGLVELYDRDPDPPPKGGIIIIHQGIPVITRNPDTPNDLYWADFSYPEGFPEAFNQRSLYSMKGGGITGLQSNIAGLEVFYPDSHYRFLGEFVDESFSFRSVSLAQGCVAHATIGQLENNQIYWLAKGGPRWMGPGGIPQVIGFGIDRLFDVRTDATVQFRLEKSVAVDIPTEKLLVFYFPVEGTAGGEVYATSNSQLWGLDYKLPQGPRWVGPWTNINMIGGAICQQGKTYFVGRRYQELTAEVRREIASFHNRGDDFDQVDHHQPISMEWAPGWEYLGEKTRKKYFLWMRLYSCDLQRLSGFSVLVQVEHDFVENVVKTEFVIDMGQGGGSAGWQFEPWGFFAWGMPNLNAQDVRIPEEEDGAFSFRTLFKHNTGYEKPILTLFSLGIRVPYELGNARK